MTSDNLGSFYDTGLDEKIRSLSDQIYFTEDSFFSPEEIKDFIKDAKRLWQEDRFRAAAIGQAREVVHSIRGDRIYWFSQEEASGPRALFQERCDCFMEKLRMVLRIPLNGFETHYAVYPKGGGYNRHFDNFQDDASRLVTMVLYLNEKWQKGDGGELRVYLPDGKIIDVEPLAGRMVCFLTPLLEHEVLPTRKERFSITTWFRRGTPFL